MKRSFITLLVMISLVMHFVSPAVAGAAGASLDVGGVTIFGVKLKDANREKFRMACKDANLLGPIESRNIQGVMTLDVYKVTGQLDGATEFSVMCAADTGELVSASYDFKAGTRVQDVIDVVTSKYGAPGETQKKSSSRPEAAFWPRADADWSIHVIQNSEDGGVALTYSHMSAFERCLKQASIKSKAEKMEKAKSQSNAF